MIARLISGCKQTEAGVIPNDWKVAKLGSLASFRTGPFGSALHKSDYVDGGIPVVNPMQIVDGRIEPTAAMTITESAARTLSDFRLQPGTIVIGRRGEMGRCAFVTEEQRGWLCGTGSMMIKPSVANDGRFLQRVLSSPVVIEAIESASVGSTMLNLNQATLANLAIPFPPTKREQEAIAGALSDADSLTESLEQLIAKKRHIKQGAMQELLTGRKRLPGFTERWAEARLGDLFTFKNGLNKGKEYFGHGTPIVNYMDVFRSSVNLPHHLQGRVEVTWAELQNFDVKEGDVFFTRTSETIEEVGMASVVLGHPKDTVFSGFVLRGRPKDERLVDAYKAYCFQSREVREQITSKASYTTRALTNGKLLSSVRLRFPEPKEQTAIATILSDMDAELAALEAKLAKTRQLKQGMMRELLTGRIRLV